MTERNSISTNDVATQPRPARNVISYIRTLDGSEHPALDSINSGVVYDIQNSVYVLEAPLESLNEEVEREANLFAEALKSYESDVPEKHKTGVDIAQPCSLKEVVELIDSSLNEYRKDGHRTVWQVVRKGFWKLSEGSEGLENWLELLPSSNDYCSLIYGGISLILKAAGRIGDVRNEAFTALAEIPAYLENTKQAVGIFSKSENLRKCGVKLYTVTLAALRHILKWFKKRAIGRAFGAFIKQGSYQAQLIDKIKEIETVSSRFKEISMVCTQKEVVNTSRMVNSLAAVSINNDAVLKEAIDQTSVKLTLKAEKTDETLEDLILSETKQHEATQQVLSDELQALKRQYGNQLELNKKTAESLNSLQALLESIYTTLPLYQISKEEGGPPPYNNIVKSSAILEILKYEKDFSENDLFQCLRAVGHMSRPEQDRAVWTMKSQKLRDWMLDTTSFTLMIHGNCSSTTARSPITFVCARLVDMLQASKRLMVIHFFCGEHIAAATDENATPMAMMNSLLAQLLMQYPGFEISGQDLAEVSRDTLGNVVRLFRKLVGQLPPSTMLFCVVDGISLYEDQVRLEETEQVMRELVALIKDGDGPVVKLMLTSATRIKHLPDSLKQDDILAVPRNVPPQSQFSPSKWESQVGSYFNEAESGAV